MRECIKNPNLGQEKPFGVTSVEDGAHSDTREADAVGLNKRDGFPQHKGGLAATVAAAVCGTMTFAGQGLRSTSGRKIKPSPS